MSFPSNLMIHGNVGLPVNTPKCLKWIQLEYGECSSEWLPDTFTIITSYDNIEWDVGDNIIIADEGTYTLHALVRKGECLCTN